MGAALPRRAAPLVAVALCGLLATGCGSHRTDNPVGLKLQREYLLAATRALEQASPEVNAEAAATKAAWPLVANGLDPSRLGAAGEAKIAAAARAAAALKVPALFGEERSTGVTGPAYSVAGDFRGFAVLASRGWGMIEYALQRERAGGAPARFARSTVALYIESVYDAHFGLAQIGKKVVDGWEMLGGEKTLGGVLPQAEVERLKNLYSEQSYRLYPHTGVKLGS